MSKMLLASLLDADLVTSSRLGGEWKETGRGTAAGKLNMAAGLAVLGFHEVWVTPFWLGHG